VKKVILGIICSIMIAVGTYRSISFQKENIPIAPETVEVKTKNLYNSVVVQGSVAGSHHQSIIFSESSNILDVYVTVGQSVKKGDKILLRRTPRVKDSSFQLFAGKLNSLLSDYGIPSELMPTVSENTALVTSALNGVVTKLQAEEDEKFPGYAVAAEICDPTVCTVIAEIPELYISSVKPRQEASIVGAAFTKDEYRGVVTEISQNTRKKINLTGERSAYLPVKIQVTNADNSLRQGCSATVKIKTEEKKNALVLPYDCITQDDAGRELVYVLKEDGKIELRRVMTGLELEDETEIIYGVKHGEVVVQNPDEIKNNRREIQK